MRNIIKKYLDIIHFSNQKDSFEDLFLSHPNYPSLYAITDSLNLLSIENIAIKVPKEQLAELPDYFLAFYNSDLILVSKTEVSINIEADNGDKKSMSYDAFQTGWSGIVLAIEPNEIVSKKTLNNNINLLQYGLPILILALLSIFFNGLVLPHLLMLITAIAGFVFSVFIIQEKLGIQNHLVAKFCNMTTNASCDSVIRSSQSKINKWVNFYDLPLVFFSASLLSLLLLPTSLAVVGLISLLSIPMILYAIWVQKFQLKKWCVLCLVVSTIIMFQGIMYAVNFNINEVFNLQNLFFYSFLLVTTIAIWNFIRPVLESKTTIQKSNTDLKKFKRNYDLFKFLLKDIPVLEGLNKLKGIEFGNKSADARLTIILSPSCSHCHKAFEDAMALVSNYPDKIFLNVLFNINPENNNNPFKVVVESMLAINNINSEHILTVISDWHIKKMELDEWKQMWKMDVIDMKVSHQIHQQYNWCLENEFNYTPVKILNNKIFPSEYEISELKYFLNNFSDDVESLNKNILVNAN
jgi:uncharacterized membrane protein